MGRSFSAAASKGDKGGGRHEKAGGWGKSKPVKAKDLKPGKGGGKHVAKGGKGDKGGKSGGSWWW